MNKVLTKISEREACLFDHAQHRTFSGCLRMTNVLNSLDLTFGNFEKVSFRIVKVTIRSFLLQCALDSKSCLHDAGTSGDRTCMRDRRK